MYELNPERNSENMPRLIPNQEQVLSHASTSVYSCLIRNLDQSESRILVKKGRISPFPLGYDVIIRSAPELFTPSLSTDTLYTYEYFRSYKEVHSLSK